jgi:hypothetical protein
MYAAVTRLLTIALGKSVVRLAIVWIVEVKPIQLKNAEVLTLDK